MLVFSNCDEHEIVTHIESDFAGSPDDKNLLLAMCLNTLMDRCVEKC